MNKKVETFLLIIILITGALLRFFKLGQVPASLYWDEAAIGLDALSISQTGKDMNNKFFLQPVFGSYGDFKAPVLILIDSVAVKFFGMNYFAIRLPVALFSTLTIYLVFILTKKILSFDKDLLGRYKLMPILAAFIVSISPWSVHFGRIAFESSLSVALLLIGLIFFLKGIQEKGFYLIIATVFASLSVYSYYSLRLIVPLFCLALIIIFVNKLKQKRAWLATAILIFVLSMLPMIKSPYYARSQDYRLNNNNLITHQQIIKESSHYLEKYNSNLYSRLVYHRYLLLARDFLINMSSHFSVNFLFLSGDANLRQHSGYLGEFLLVSLPFYYLGLFLLCKNFKTKTSIFLLVFMILSPIPAAMVYEVPHASRAIYLFVPFAMLIAYGLNEFLLYGKKIAAALLLIAFLVNATFYYADYFIDYPKRSSQAWLYSYEQVAAYIKDHYQEFSKIEIDERYWFPTIFVYYQFPELLDQTRELKNAFLNSPVNSFGLPDPFNYLLKQDGQQNKKQAKFIYHEAPIPEGFVLTKEFNFLNGDKSLVLVTK